MRPFNLLLLLSIHMPQHGSKMPFRLFTPFVPFMLFLFRLLERP